MDVLVLGVALAVGALPASAGAAAERGRPAVAREATGTSIDSGDLEAFLDGVIKSRMDSSRVVGVTVSVVHDGQMVFAKGYGYANLDARTPVDPATTMFRIGSISKTFTWTAAMQLVERGQLDLHEDIRQYLKSVTIPDTFPQPITTLDLMAHTAGFEESFAGHLFQKDPNAVRTLAGYLRRYQPARVRPPGEEPAYSNYGAGLAGLEIADITGMPFEDYMDRNILEPLGMTHSTFREPWKNLDLRPMPAEEVAKVSTGYTDLGGVLAPGPFEFIHQLAPAGGLATTATDMARFMLMHLGDGTYDGAQILEPATARLMHKRSFVYDGAANGFAHGFIEQRVHGYRAIGHAGGTQYFVSDMVLVPELDFGLFVSTNTTTGTQVTRDLASLVVGRYFPPKGEPVQAQPPADFARTGRRFAGSYLTNRRSYTKIEKLFSAIGGATRVAVTRDGHLVTYMYGDAQEWVQVAPLTFREVDGERTLVFVADQRGRIVQMVPDMPVMVLDRVGFLASSSTTIGVAVMSLLVSLGVLTIAWFRRKYVVEQSGGERVAARVVVLTATVWIVFFVLFGMAAAVLSAPGSNAVIYDFPPAPLVWALVVALAGIVGTVTSVVLLYAVWTRRSWSMGRRLRHTAVVAVFVSLVLLLNELNMIGFKYF